MKIQKDMGHLTRNDRLTRNEKQKEDLLALKAAWKSLMPSMQANIFRVNFK